MKKKYFTMLIAVVLCLLAGGLLWQMCTNSNQAMAAFVVETEFEGEYRQNGEEWKTLTKDTKLSSYGGDLQLRGKFKDMAPMYYSFHLNHIGASISINGKEVFYSGRFNDDLPEMVCNDTWVGFEADNMKETDKVEIRLHNPHRYGNADAYQQFLESFCLGGGEALERHCKEQSGIWSVASMVMGVLSIALLGAALGYMLQRIPMGTRLWSLASLTLFMSGYLFWDSEDIFFRCSGLVLNTCMRQYCILFAGLAFAGCVQRTLTESRQILAKYIKFGLCIADAILLILPLVQLMELYDTQPYWAVIQGCCMLALAVLCILELTQRKKNDQILLGCYLVLTVVTIAELVNARMNFWKNGIALKWTFLLLFVWQLVRAIWQIALNQRKSMKVEKLSEELKNSRIVLSMSQIRTHFIFNVLNAISGYCKSDPKKADQELIRFSRYLRHNVNFMEEDKPMPFTKELEHLQDYVALEQMRFEDQIKFETDIQEKDFLIPPLTLQPLVENAIKHGILKKEDGSGIIVLRTIRKGKKVEITVADDGVGFAPEEEKKEGSVGVKNVRFRVEQMMHGTMKIVSDPGNGTKVTIKLPMK
ncbi:MAG: sensor histidine kinase [Lachnospiraceae bacterium]